MSSSSECVLREGHVEYMFLTWYLTLPPYLTVKGLSNGMWKGEYLGRKLESRNGSTDNPLSHSGPVCRCCG